MIKVENVEVFGYEPALRGMRNPKNSWGYSDSSWYDIEGYSGDGFYDGEGNVFSIGPKDFKLMKQLFHAGTEHRKYARMMIVSMDITASQTWWSEFDTYKVGTVRNSCSKMHKINAREIVKSDIDHEGVDLVGGFAEEHLKNTLTTLEHLRNLFNSTGDKKYWRALIELLPMGYHLKATVMMNYEVAENIINQREGHKLDEWRTFCSILKDLPYMKELRKQDIGVLNSKLVVILSKIFSLLSVATDDEKEKIRKTVLEFLEKMK